MSGESWCPIVVDDARCLLYGPRLGRFYLVSRDRVRDQAFLDVIGLRGHPAASLPDPVERIAFTANDLHAAEVSDKPKRQIAAYKVLHRSRHILPLRLAASLLRKLATRPHRPHCGASNDIAGLARSVHRLESAAGFADCYPRALMTAYLALKARYRCVLTIGALAPTRKMHAWCSIDGVLPYEPTPEHYLYQPLWMRVLTP